MVRRTKEEAQETRSRILDAAVGVFLERGVSRTSLNEIALAAGVTRGAIYWHFQDKADLFNAMMARATLPFEEAGRRLEDPENDEPLDVLRQNVSDVFHRVVEDPEMRRVFEIAIHKVEYVAEMKAVRDRHLSVRDMKTVQMRGGLALAASRGQLRRGVSPSAAAIGAHALIGGLLQNWMLEPGSFDLVEVGLQAFDTYLAGLRVTTA